MNLDIRNTFHCRIHSILLSALALVLFACSAAVAKARIVKIKTEADSEKTGYESFRAMDGDPSTMWHSFFGDQNPKPPHVIILDLGDVYEISGFIYLPRRDSDNGTIKDYEFYVSNDKKEFGPPVIKGAFAKRNGENIIKFQKPAKAAISN